jgi:hypothetical protein
MPLSVAKSVSSSCPCIPQNTDAFTSRYASLFVTLAGGLVNSLLTLQLASSWNTLQALDAESELDAWKLDGLRVLWALLAWYLLAAAFVSFVGFFGVLRVSASLWEFCVLFSSWECGVVGCGPEIGWYWEAGVRSRRWVGDGGRMGFAGLLLSFDLAEWLGLSLRVKELRHCGGCGTTTVCRRERGRVWSLGS